MDWFQVSQQRGLCQGCLLCCQSLRAQLHLLLLLL
jgi:hypothetical protein